MIKTIKSFKYALNGLKTVFKEENSFRLEVIAGMIVVFFMFYFNFSLFENIICILLITLVLSAEIVNTAIEDLCNKVEPNQDPIIGKVKDTMSAFVLLTSLGALIVGVLVFYSHFI